MQLVANVCKQPMCFAHNTGKSSCSNDEKFDTSESLYTCFYHTQLFKIVSLLGNVAIIQPQLDVTILQHWNLTLKIFQLYSSAWLNLTLRKNNEKYKKYQQVWIAPAMLPKISSTRTPSVPAAVYDRWKLQESRIQLEAEHVSRVYSSTPKRNPIREIYKYRKVENETTRNALMKQNENVFYFFQGLCSFTRCHFTSRSNPPYLPLPSRTWHMLTPCCTLGL